MAAAVAATGRNKYTCNGCSGTRQGERRQPSSRVGRVIKMQRKRRWGVEGVGRVDAQDAAFFLLCALLLRTGGAQPQHGSQSPSAGQAPWQACIGRTGDVRTGC